MVRPFSFLYRKVMAWARHRHAPWYLLALSIAESSFFPIPPDVMLAPMALGRREKAWFYAALATAGSVIGGVLGYGLGFFAFELVHPWILEAGYGPAYERASGWFHAWGFWAILVAGFSPIPYKVFTIAAGALAMPLVPFILASLVGRGARFFLLAGLMVLLGERMERALHTYIDRIGWATVALLATAYLWTHAG